MSKDRGVLYSMKGKKLSNGLEEEFENEDESPDDDSNNVESPDDDDEDNKNESDLYNGEYDDWN